MTEPLQMMRAEINARDFQRWMGMRRLQDPDHGMHCLLTECFGRDLAPRPFRAIFPRGGSQGCLYGYGGASAAELREAASAYADPLQCRIIPPHGIDSKPMPAEWTAGKRLGFEVRIHPTRRLNSGSLKTRRVQDIEKLPSGEWDAFQLEASPMSERNNATQP